ncbi:MAG: phosphate ABC transporter permease PstA, partial [Spirochaetia bacterium]|nr:phosphate ABC transporter permease PstA [Spirochaetia bacterium]
MIGSTLTKFEMRRRRSDTVAVALIKIWAITAIVILIVIIGYIMFKGMVSQSLQESQSIPKLSTTDQGFVVIANKKSGLRSMSYDVLRQFYDGRSFSLRKISQVNEDVKLYFETGLKSSVSEYLLLDEKSLQRSEALEASTSDVVAYVSANAGGIGLVSEAIDLPNNVIVLQLDDVVLAVHPSVTELLGNIKLSKIAQENVEPLLEGAFSNWKDLQGQDLEIVVVNSLQQVKQTPGAVAPVGFRDAYLEDVQTLQILSSQTKKNFTFRYIWEKPIEMGKYGGISTIIGNTLLMVFVTLLFSVPLGVGSAVFMVEFRANKRLLSIARTGVDLLAGVPSIIFGLFGLLVFVQLAGWSFSLLSGSMTLALMVLPTIIRTSEEALLSVSPSLKEASVALGATKWETIMKVLLPAASPGIVTGIILAIGRAVGETAP